MPQIVKRLAEKVRMGIRSLPTRPPKLKLQFKRYVETVYNNIDHGPKGIIGIDRGPDTTVSYKTGYPETIGSQRLEIAPGAWITVNRDCDITEIEIHHSGQTEFLEEVCRDP